MDNLLSKVFSFLNAAFEPKEEEPVKRVDFLYEPPPGLIIEDKPTYRLVSYAEPDGPAYTLSFPDKRITGPQEYSWPNIEKVLYFPHRRQDERRHLLAIKIRLGPLLFFENFGSEASALAHMERFVSRLGRRDALCRSYLDMRTADPFPALKQALMKGRFEAGSIAFRPNRVHFPLMVDFDEPEKYCTVADLVFCKTAGLHLYDGLGRKELVAKLEDITDLTSEESVRYFSDSDAELIILRFHFKRDFLIEVVFVAQEIHDDRIPGEIEESERDMQLGRSVFRQLRQFLGLVTVQ